MRIDMHFFAYQYTPSQLTDIYKQVMSANIVVSSVDTRKLNDNTLRAIVQNVLLSSPSPKAMADALFQAVNKVGNPKNDLITEKVTFTIRTIIGTALGSAGRFEGYLWGASI
ncbi:hypothetical protein F5Y10DRAFT_265273 [Nemania abortiva]|nr:hypothetical protein F5Y10DRAFT_265273 [Nemania abortiva]